MLMFYIHVFFFFFFLREIYLLNACMVLLYTWDAVRYLPKVLFKSGLNPLSNLEVKVMDLKKLFLYFIILNFYIQPLRRKITYLEILCYNFVYSFLKKCVSLMPGCIKIVFGLIIDTDSKF